MIGSRDYVMRQVHQLARALATALGKRNAMADVELERTISDAVVAVTGVDLAQLRRASREELVEMCTRDGAFNTDIALGIAELLMVDGSADLSERALWLYQESLRVGGTLPHDIHDRIANLQRS